MRERSGSVHGGVNLLRDPLRQQVGITIGTSGSADEFNVLRPVR